MKKLILLAIFGLGIPLPAHATVFEFAFTDQNAVENNPGHWLPLHSDDILVAGVGGDAGEAQLFDLDHEVQFLHLNIDATVRPEAKGTTTINFNLYSKSDFQFGVNSPVPDPSSMFFSSGPLEYTSTQEQVDSDKVFPLSAQIPFNVDLQPGSYWLAEEGYGPNFFNFNSITYDSAETGVVPEPSSLWLLLLGLGGVFMAQRWTRIADSF